MVHPRILDPQEISGNHKKPPFLEIHLQLVDCHDRLMDPEALEELLGGPPASGLTLVEAPVDCVWGAA